MLLIQQITANPLQRQSLVLPDGSTFFLEIYFRPLQKGWFINELTYLDFTVRGVRITNNPNILYPFKNKLPFGLGCFSTANREPGLIDDFASGASKLYVLTEAEVEELEGFYSGG